MIEFTGTPVERPSCGSGNKSDRPLVERKRLHYLSKHEHYKDAARKAHHRQNSERDVERITKWKHDNPDRVARSRLLKNAKIRARQLNLPFNIGLEDVTIPEVCPVLGIPLVFGRGVVCDGSPSLDRVQPHLGYVKGNVAVISHRANKIKSCGSAEEHEAVIQFMRGFGA